MKNKQKILRNIRDSKFRILIVSDILKQKEKRDRDSENEIDRESETDREGQRVRDRQRYIDR